MIAVSAQSCAGGTSAQAQASAEAGRRWAASPLLVDPDIPESVIAEVVDTTEVGGEEMIGVLVELNLRSGADPETCLENFFEVYNRALESSAAGREPGPYQVSSAFLRCLLTRSEIQHLLAWDKDHGAEVTGGPRSIFRIWPDYVLHPLIDRSVSTVKIDAASRTYGATGADVVWAVLDTGVQADHPHFEGGNLSDPVVKDLHRDFTHIVRDEPPPKKYNPNDALTDENGHGTHVAGIIAGRLPERCQARIAELEASTGNDLGLPRWVPRTLDDGRTLAGMAPDALIVSLKVLDTSTGTPKTTSSAVIAALEYVRRVNTWGRLLVIHGVNLSLGCPWFYRDYAAGQSPLCRELDLLVGTGVAAVVSAGNGGYAQGGGLGEEAAGLHGVLSTITDPGNAARAITVGATHRDRPHSYGVTYASSKGPTLDGRLKPDLVAPGERITSCAAGAFRGGIPLFQDLPPSDGTACYAEDSGTSMAAPHVSGAIAALLSARPEFKGQPDEVKRLFCESAISLGRDRFFEGHGLLDVMGVLARV
jgi:subtilisin family serine protease